MKLDQITYPQQNVCTLYMSETAEVLEAKTQAAYEAKRADLKIRGYERGEATREQAEAVKGADYFWFDATNQIMDEEVPGIYNAVVAEHGFIVVSECDYGLESISKEDGFVVTATFCLLPTFKLGDYKSITITQGSAKVTDEEVERVIAAQKEMKPELLEEFRAQVRAKLTENKALTVVNEAQNAVITSLADIAEGEIPAKMIDDAYEGMVSQLNDMLNQQGMDMQSFLDKVGHTKEEFRAHTRKGADRRVRATLALMQIGVEAGFVPTPEEVEAEIAVRAEQVKDKVKDFATKADRRRVMLSIIRTKATALVLANATIIDPDKAE